jgi:hypothetical protein
MGPGVIVQDAKVITRKGHPREMPLVKIFERTSSRRITKVYLLLDQSLTSKAHRFTILGYQPFQGQISPAARLRSIFVRKLVAALFCAAVCTAAIAQQAINNDSVVKMVKAGLF